MGSFGRVAWLKPSQTLTLRSHHFCFYLNWKLEQHLCFGLHITLFIIGFGLLLALLSCVCLVLAYHALFVDRIAKQVRLLTQKKIHDNFYSSWVDTFLIIFYFNSLTSTFFFTNIPLTIYYINQIWNFFQKFFICFCVHHGWDWPMILL